MNDNVFSYIDILEYSEKSSLAFLFISVDFSLFSGQHLFSSKNGIVLYSNSLDGNV